MNHTVRIRRRHKSCSTRAEQGWIRYTVGLIGFPFNAVLAWPMATQSGYAFFLKPEVNGKMRVILDTCRDKVLKTGLSQYVLRETKAGSLQPELPKVIAQYTNPTAENGLHLKSCSSATKNGLTEDLYLGMPLLSENSKTSIVSDLLPSQPIITGWCPLA